LHIDNADDNTQKQNESESTDDVNTFIPRTDYGDTESGILAMDGQTNYRIVIPAGGNEAAEYAASELAKYLEMITGAKYLVVEDTAAETEYEILLGKTSHGTFDVDYDDIGIEGFTILTRGTNAERIIIGGVERGLIYGVYEFLEAYCGCRFYTDSFEVIPENTSLTISAINDTQKPYFEYRDNFWVESFTSEYRMKRKSNTPSTSGYTEVSPMIGGYIGIYISLRYTYQFQTCTSHQYFDDHPEYYAMNSNGNREATQLCLTNPEVYDIAIAKIRSVLGENPTPQIFSITQEDNNGYCRCAECSAVNEEENTSGGTNIRFVNAIAAELADEYPEVIFATFAYQYTLNPPEVTKPLENVIIRLCPANVCCSHAIKDQCSVSSQTFVKALLGWSEICERIHIWNYTTNFTHYVSPFPNLYELREDIQFYYENNIKGMFVQGNWNAVSGEFGELRAYLINKLLWNPVMSEEEYTMHINEFLEAYYGAGWEAIREYIDLIDADSDKKHFIEYDNPDESIIAVRYKKVDGYQAVDMTFIEQLNDCFARAKAACADDEVSLARVERSELALRVLNLFWNKDRIYLDNKRATRLASEAEKTGDAELMAKASEVAAQCAADQEEFAIMSEKLYDDIVAFGIDRVRSQEALPAKYTIDFNLADWVNNSSRDTVQN